MEHRLSKRITTDLDLLVYKRGMPVATGKIRDASRKGLFILTDYTDVQLNQELEIELRFPDCPEQLLRRIRAQVVRKTGQGLGVDFEEVDNDVFTISSLVRWLHRYRAPKIEDHPAPRRSLMH